MNTDRWTLASSGATAGAPGGAPASRPAFRCVLATLAFVVLGFVVVSAAGRPAAQELTVWDGVYTEAQARRGEPVYDAECSECHGPGMEGIDMAPGLAGGDFVWNWDGLPLGDLFERIRISMPQADPTSVSRAEKADILAYMLEMSGFPAGDAELSARARELNRVTFRALQP
ncbi:MAG: cytochrome c [Acidobacteria bacterium]|nr:cytochrome c [Acidobacteriota bacterium]